MLIKFCLFVVFTLMIQQNDALFNLHAYTSDLNIIANKETYCNNEETCYNSYKYLISMPNIEYVCFYPYENDLNCFRYADKSQYKYKGNFGSFGIVHLHKFIRIIDDTIYESQNFYGSIFIQCLHYDMYTGMTAFCIGE